VLLIWLIYPEVRVIQVIREAIRFALSIPGTAVAAIGFDRDRTSASKWRIGDLNR
jgi:hypothetical protein